jgi:hypothetical protein
MDPSHKYATHNSTSLEGAGLSVSLHPEEWRQIAKLGGNPTWSLRMAGGMDAEFLDVHSLSDQHWVAVMDWACRHGFATKTQVIRVGWYDSEVDDFCAFTYPTSDPAKVAEAKAEYEALKEFDDDATYEVVDGFEATQALNERIGFAVESSLVSDMALTLYVESVLATSDGIQGLWWSDELDVHAYSAPRGVISLNALDQWEWEIVGDPVPRSNLGI